MTKFGDDGHERRRPFISFWHEMYCKNKHTHTHKMYKCTSTDTLTHSGTQDCDIVYILAFKKFQHLFLYKNGLNSLCVRTVHVCGKNVINQIHSRTVPSKIEHLLWSVRALPWKFGIALNIIAQHDSTRLDKRGWLDLTQPWAFKTRLDGGAGGQLSLPPPPMIFSSPERFRPSSVNF